jgi:hypothetical protein
MAIDEIKICNKALSRIGITMKIASLDNPRSKEAIELAQVFEDVRDEVLTSTFWPFAKKIVDLQETGTPPSKWAKRYAYPNDCLAVRTIYPRGGSGALDTKTPYEVMLGDDDTLTICTDQAFAVMEYTKRVTNPGLFDALFSNALSWALAAEVALPLAKTIDHARNALAMYKETVREAMAKAKNEEVRQDPPDSEFVQVRL